MKKLKNIDFKALFINHGEKFGLGLIVLIVVLALSGTSWSRFEKSPGDLENKVNEADRKITTNNPWPQSKQDQFVIVDFNDKARDVFTGLNSARYEFTTPLYWPLYKKKEKAREPEFSTPQFLIAHAGQAVLAISNQPPVPETMENPESTEPAEAPSSNRKPPPGANSAAGFAPGTPGAHAAANPGVTTPPSFGITPSRVPASGPRGAHSAMPDSDAMPGFTPGFGGGGVTARGKRFIAIRAIVPIKEQIERAMKAMNLTYAEASAAIEYTDFVLMRQAAVAGPDPWTGEWEVVELDHALEVLNDCQNFDPDPVPSELQDAVFTMALPARLLEYWGDNATHPNIKHFRLSEAEYEKEMKLQEKMLEEYKKIEQLSEQRIKRKGLAGAVNDIRGIGQALVRQSDSNTSAMYQQMQQMMNEGANGPRMAPTDIKNRMTASGRLYLFRFFDFDVQPGMAYRYKLQLELRNPNFGRAYEELDNEAFAKGEYRKTDWSNISNVAVVPKTVNYFLKEVERDPVREEKSKKAVANISMFAWDADLGTMLVDSLKILSVGQFISEKKKSLKLDPAIPSFEETDVTFATEDVLLDASGDLQVSPELHPDLQLKPDRGKKDATIGMLPEALVVTASGELQELDPVSQQGAEKKLERHVKEERQDFEYLKNKPKETTGALDGAYPGMPAGMQGMPMPGETKMRSNPRKKSGPSGGHGGADAGDGGARASRPPAGGAPRSQPRRSTYSP